MKKINCLLTMFLLIFLTHGSINVFAEDNSKFNIELDVIPNVIHSSGNYTLFVQLNASANSLPDNQNLIALTIPTEMVNDNSQFRLINGDGFYFDRYEQLGTNYIVYIRFDPTMDNEQQWSATIRLTLTAPLIKNDSPISREQEFSVELNGQISTKTVSVEPEEFGTQLIFEKWAKFGHNNAGTYELNPRNSRYNLFHLAVNMNSTESFNNVVVSDELPTGLKIDENQDATDGIAGTDEERKANVHGIRVIKIDIETDRRYYVTQEYLDKINYDAATESFLVSLGDISNEDQFIIEYYTKVAGVLDSYVNVAKFEGIDVNNNLQIINRSVYCTLLGGEAENTVLSKRVNLETIEQGQRELVYTLVLTAVMGDIQPGYVVKDRLDEKFSFSNSNALKTSFFDASFDFNANELELFVNRTIPVGTQAVYSFSVDPSQFQATDIIYNVASTHINGFDYVTNRVVTNVTKVEWDIPEVPEVPEAPEVPEVPEVPKVSAETINSSFPSFLNISNGEVLLKSTESKNQSYLPKTDEKSSNNYIILGIVLCGIAGLIYSRKEIER